MNVIVHVNDLPDNFVLEGDLAIDSETMGTRPDRDDLCLIQLTNGNGEVHLVQFIDRKYSAPNLQNILSDPARVKIFHVARFDLAFIKKYLNVSLTNIFCTKIASKLTRTYTEYHSLKELCRELLDVSISKQQQCSNWSSEKLTKAQIEYAAKDVFYLHQLRDIFLTRLTNVGRLEIANRLFSFLPARVDLDLMGWNEVDIFAYN